MAQQMLIDHAIAHGQLQSWVVEKGFLQGRGSFLWGGGVGGWVPFRGGK